MADVLTGGALTPVIGSVLSTLLAATQSWLRPAMSLCRGLRPSRTAPRGTGLGMLPVLALPLMLPSVSDYDGALRAVLTGPVGLDDADATQIVNAQLLPLPGNYPFYPQSNAVSPYTVAAPLGVRNVMGLTPLGQYAVQQMMSLGMMLDVDHMGRKSFAGVLGIATNVPGGYPLNSGHNGFMDLSYSRSENTRSTNQLDQLSQLGGMMGVGWGNARVAVGAGR